MLHSKKGAALFQVLLITVVLAGMATMLLRASLSRTSSMRQSRRTVSAQLLINTCMSEINTLWSVKKPEIFARDRENCYMWCNAEEGETCTLTGSSANASRSYTCQVSNGGNEYNVEAKFTGTSSTADGCELTYTITNAGDGTEVNF